MENKDKISSSIIGLKNHEESEKVVSISNSHESFDQFFQSIISEPIYDGGGIAISVHSDADEEIKTDFAKLKILHIQRQTEPVQIKEIVDQQSNQKNNAYASQKLSEIDPSLIEINSSNVPEIADLARNYFVGCYGKSCNHWKAFQLYKKLAKFGDPLSQNYLGICYLYGYGCKKSYQNASKWLTQASVNGCDSTTQLEKAIRGDD